MQASEVGRVLNKTAMNFHAKEKSSRKAIEKSSMKYSVAKAIGRYRKTLDVI